MGARVWGGSGTGSDRSAKCRRRPERMRAGTCPSDSPGWGQKVDGTQTRLQ